MFFGVSLLGVSGAVPAYGRFPTSQLVRLGGHTYLVDCGEGAQMQMQTFGFGHAGLRQVFISHLHGDHVYGLPGLISSMALNSRREPLHLYSPPGLADLLSSLQLNPQGRPFPLVYHEFDPAISTRIFSDRGLSVQTIPLYHRIPTAGFLFREHPRERNLRPDVVNEYRIPYGDIPLIKSGADWRSPQGTVLPNEQLTTDPPPPRAYAFCTDTRYLDTTVTYVQGVDLLYHEATFADEHLDLAIETRHTTAPEAARIAQAAQVGQLILGHFSARYPDPERLVLEARAIFPNTHAGTEGQTYEIPFQQRW